MRVTGQVEGAGAAEMDGVVHEPLEGKEKDGPELTAAAQRALRHRTAVHPAGEALEPAAGDVVVDGLRVDVAGPQPWRVHYETGRDRVEERL